MVEADKTSNVSFLYNVIETKIVTEFRYFRVIFSRAGSFYSTSKYVVTRDSRVIYATIKKSRKLNLLT